MEDLRTGWDEDEDEVEKGRAVCAVSCGVERHEMILVKTRKDSEVGCAQTLETAYLWRLEMMLYSCLYRSKRQGSLSCVSQVVVEGVVFNSRMAV